MSKKRDRNAVQGRGDAGEYESPSEPTAARVSGSRQTGVVKWFDDGKGYGFIRRGVPGGGGADLFVHFSSIQSEGYKTLAEGARVEFDVQPTAKGEQATNVVVLEGG